MACCPTAGSIPSPAGLCTAQFTAAPAAVYTVATAGNCAVNIVVNVCFYGDFYCSYVNCGRMFTCTVYMNANLEITDVDRETPVLQP
jgi:hypothetical protein